MPSPDKRSVIVRVEVEFPERVQRVKPVRRRRGGVKIELTRIDVPDGTAKVRDSGGGLGSICATGNSTNDDGDAADTVYAKIYPAGTTVFDASPLGVGDVSETTPDEDGDWVFSSALEIPKATHNAGGTAGNILHTWAKYDGIAGYEEKNRAFFGLTSSGTDCLAGPGSGSSSGSPQFSVTGGLAFAGKPLHATFMGSLSSLGSLVLHWNGVYWMGMVPATGAQLSFFAADTNCTLGCSGEGIAFLVAGPPTSFAPFSWSAEGTVSGKKPGGFRVIVTE